MVKKIVSPLDQVRPLEIFKHMPTHGLINAVVAQLEKDVTAVQKIKTYDGDKPALADDVKSVIDGYTQYINSDTVQMNQLLLRSTRINKLEFGLIASKPHALRFELIGRTLAAESDVIVKAKGEEILIKVPDFEKALEKYGEAIEAAKIKARDAPEDLRFDDEIAETEASNIHESVINQFIPDAFQQQPNQTSYLTPIANRRPYEVIIEETQEIIDDHNQVPNNANNFSVNQHLSHVRKEFTAINDALEQLGSRLDSLMNSAPSSNQTFSYASSAHFDIPRAAQNNQTLPKFERAPPSTNNQPVAASSNNRSPSIKSTLDTTDMSLGLSAASIDAIVKKEAQPDHSSTSVDFGSTQRFRPELPEFSGAPGSIQFKHFWAVFRVMVHNQPTLSEHEKIIALYQKIKPPASDLLSANPYRPGGYVEAIERLLRAYGSALSDTSGLFNDLCNLPQLSAHQFGQLQHMIARMRTILEEMADSDPGLISSQRTHSIVVSKIPIEYLTQIRAQNTKYTIQQFLNIVECEIVARRQMFAARRPLPPTIQTNQGGYSNQLSNNFRSPRFTNNQYGNNRRQWNNRSGQPVNQNSRLRPTQFRQDNRSPRFGNQTRGRAQPYQNTPASRQFTPRRFAQINMEDPEVIEYPRQEEADYDDYNQYDDGANYDDLYYDDGDWCDNNQEQYEQQYEQEDGNQDEGCEDTEEINQEAALMAIEHQRKQKCFFCRHASHASKDCRIVTDLQMRRRLFISGGRCLKCEGMGHQQQECKAAVKCSICSSTEHCPALCNKQDFHKSGQNRSQ